MCDLNSHTIHYGSVYNQHGEELDHVLFLLMRGPKSFTGEDTIEITCHNNPFIINNIIDALCSAGARTAQAGEFTRQAIENDKIDIIQAEAINELVHANSQKALSLSLAQIKGTLSAWIASIEEHLIKMLAFSEASFEFLDEEGISFLPQIQLLLEDIALAINTAQKATTAQKTIREGIKIVLIGSVNAGKSSLFNALVGSNRAIVTDIAGTTRDIIETGRYKDGYYQTFIDTAGIRETHDIIEQIGIQKSYEYATLADVIVLIFDASRPLSLQEQTVYKNIQNQHAHKIINIATKADLPKLLQEEYCHGIRHMISIKDDVSINMFETDLALHIQQCMQHTNIPFLLNQRHHDRLQTLAKHINILKQLLYDPVPYELVSHHIKEALSELAELTGKTISEKGMDTIFRQFCIGK